MNLSAKIRMQLSSKSECVLSFLHLFRYTGKTVPMTQSETPYIYFVLGGEFRLYTPGGTLVAGGYPLFANGKIAGGIGVGGGTEAQDCAIAEYMVSVFEEMTK